MVSCPPVYICIVCVGSSMDRNMLFSTGDGPREELFLCPSFLYQTYVVLTREAQLLYQIHFQCDLDCNWHHTNFQLLHRLKFSSPYSKENFQKAFPFLSWFEIWSQKISIWILTQLLSCVTSGLALPLGHQFPHLSSEDNHFCPAKWMGIIWVG